MSDASTLAAFTLVAFTLSRVDQGERRIEGPLELLECGPVDDLVRRIDPFLEQRRVVQQLGRLPRALNFGLVELAQADFLVLRTPTPARVVARAAIAIAAVVVPDAIEGELGDVGLARSHLTVPETDRSLPQLGDSDEAKIEHAIRRMPRRGWAES